MDWKVTTEPTIEPVTLAEAKLHLKVEHSADDDLIEELIKTARQNCEQFHGRAYIEQTITAKLDRFTDTIILPYPPLISVTTVKYIDTDGNQQTLNSGYYDVDTTSEPGIITLGYNDTWPVIRDVHHAVEIALKAGYGDEAADVPAFIKSAIKLTLGYLYENRGDGEKTEKVPSKAKALLWPTRCF